MNCSLKNNMDGCPSRSAWPNAARALVGALCVMSVVALSADTVELRDGRRFQNVKTKVSGGTISVTSSNGRTQSFPARDVKGIVPEAVRWPARVLPRKEPASVKEPVKEAPKAEQPEKREPLPRKADESRVGRTGKDTIVSMVEGLVPLWSGLYRRDRPGWGALFSGLEFYALYRVLPWLPAGKAWEERIAPQIGAASLFVLPPGAPPPTPGTGAQFNGRFFTDTYGLIAAQQLAVHPVTDGSIARRDFDRTRSTRLAALGVVLVLDALASGFFPEAPAHTGGGRNGTTRAADSLRVFAVPEMDPARGRGLVFGLTLGF